MDWLEVVFEKKSSAIAGIDLKADVYVNRKLFNRCLDIGVFFRAIKDNGRYPLFSCDCGTFECRGYYADIVCNETEWILRNLYYLLIMN